MLRTEALSILGLKDDHDEATLRARYAELVKTSHPDTGGGVEQAARLTKLRRAKDFLAERFKFLDGLPECARCKGRGVIAGLSKFGTTCKSCQGTGRDTRKR